jgi:F0F1-type ATP synthase assembly protein I
VNDDDLRAKRELNTGFANALSRAFEFAATTALFAGLGWLVDRWLGTAPAFLIALTVLALIGQFARFWYAYDAEMRVHERDLEDRKRGTGRHTVEARTIEARTMEASS